MLKLKQTGADITAETNETVFLLKNTDKGIQLLPCGIDNANPLAEDEKNNVLSAMCGLSYSDSLAKNHKTLLDQLSADIITARIKAKQPFLGMKVL